MKNVQINVNNEYWYVMQVEDNLVNKIFGRCFNSLGEVFTFLKELEQ